MPKANDASISTIKHIAIDRLKWANGFADALLGSLSEEQLMKRAGGRGNHPLWIMGHLASSNDQIVAALKGESPRLPQAFHALFSGGTTPTDNRADYPSRDDLVSALNSTRQRTLEWVESLDEATALAPSPEPLRAFAPDAISTALTIASHDLYHLGQVASVRASLGLKPLMR